MLVAFLFRMCPHLGVGIEKGWAPNCLPSYLPPLVHLKSTLFQTIYIVYDRK